MTTFIGYSSVRQNKKFTLTDAELIKQDLLNAFNIRQGQLPGIPAYGSTIWDLLFENQTQETEQAIMEEVQRVAGLDPRIQISSVQMFPWDVGILIQIEIIMLPANVPEMLHLFFNNDNRSASMITPT